MSIFQTFVPQYISNNVLLYATMYYPVLDFSPTAEVD